MKKILIAFSSLCIATSLFGHENMQERVDNLEKEMQEVSTVTAYDTIGAGFTTARPEVEGKNFFITFDILYWHAKIGGTEYAYSYNPQIIYDQQDVPFLLPARDGRTKDHDFDWEWGLKAGLGYNISYDGWDVYAQYTWYESNSSSQSAKEPPAGLSPLRSFDEMIASKAKSSFDVDYNNVDLEIGRSFYISSFLSFRPFISLKSAWIDLKQDSVYTASPLNDDVFRFFDDPRTNGLDFKVKESCQYWGLGPRVGVNSHWHLGYGYSIFGDVAGSVLYSYFKTLHRESWPPHTVALIDPENGQLFKLRSNFHRFVPYVQIFGGLEWDGYVNHKHQHIRLKLGYEVQYYWRVNQNFYAEDTTRTGFGTLPEHVRAQFEKTAEDVMFYGITGEFRLDF